MQLRCLITRLLPQALVAMLVLASCIEDKIDDNFDMADNQGTPQQNQYVIALDIQSAGGTATRASFADEDLSKAKDGDLIYGSEEEHELIGPTGNYLFLFAKDKNDAGEVIEDSPEKLVAISDILLPNHTHNPADSAGSGGGVKDDDDKIKDNIEARYESKFKVPSEITPTSCLVLLNGKRFEDESEFRETSITAIRQAIADGEVYTASDIMKNMVDKVDKDGDPHVIGRDLGEDGKPKYFTMSNSVYMVKDDTGNYKLQTAVPIPKDLIQEAENFDPKKALTIYVERMVAKFTFELQTEETLVGEEIKDVPKTLYKFTDANPLYLFSNIDEEGSLTSQAIPWWIELKGWGINGLETVNYIFKNLPEDISANGNNYYVPGDWSDPGNYRTYWSIDPHYEGTEYPWQYRKMYDWKWNWDDNGTTRNDREYPNFSYYEELDQEHEHDRQNLLRNYSYNEFEAKLSQQDFNRTVYVPENTYDYLSDPDFSKNLDDRPHRLAGTHLLVGAVLLTNINGEGGEFKPNDLFRDRSGIYYKSEEDCFHSLIHSFNRYLSSQSAMEFTYYNWDDDTKSDEEKNGLRMAIRPTDANNKDLKYNLWYNDQPVTYKSDMSDYKLAKAVIKDGDGKRMPWPDKVTFSIKTDNGEALTEVYNPRENEADTWKDKLRTDVTVDQNVIKSLMYEWLGSVDHFNEGRMYYSKPVQNTKEGSGDIFYGVVRNGWYRFVLKDVKSIGTSVDDPEQPIVPIVVETHDQLNVKIEIIPWHEVSHNVPMLPGKYLQ